MTVFHCQQSRVGRVLTLVMSGSMDEYSVFPAVDTADCEAIFIDLAGVGIINSAGIRNWIRWIPQLAASLPNCKLVLLGCPKIFINQVNIIENVIPAGTRVQSCFVPYVCESCGWSEDRKVEYGKDYEEFTDDDLEQKVRIPEVSCPNCRKPAEADIQPALYFNFLRKE